MIKKFFRLILLFTFCLITENYLWGNLVFNQQLKTILLVATILSAFDIFIKPIVKILLLPISIITLGGIRIAINTVGLYLATSLISDFTVTNIDSSSFYWQGFTIPKFHFEGIIAYIVTSLTLGIIFNLYNFILKRKATK